jgi:D-alanyl-D-alanine carboxypeptidase
MAERLRRALDPRLRSRETRDALAEMERRRSLACAEGIVVAGGAGRLADARGGTPLAVHRSNPLVRILKRLNSYSNNDIERLAATLGGPEELGAWLGESLGIEAGLATLSGLGTNRMTPRSVVRLMGRLGTTAERAGIRPDDVLPVVGCDPGTMHHFPGLARGLPQGSLVAKTGTLSSTDGGVVVLAGVARTGAETEVFCVAAPRSGSRLRGARADVERWLIDRFHAGGEAGPQACGLGVEFSDGGASVIAVE